MRTLVKSQLCMILHSDKSEKIEFHLAGLVNCDNLVNTVELSLLRKSPSFAMKLVLRVEFGSKMLVVAL